jgi:cysteine desulfurase
MIYVDNAATTKMDRNAFNAMLSYLDENYGNPSSAYLFAKKSKNAIKNARISIASCIGANNDNIYFTSGGTESNNWAIKGAAFLLMKKGKHIITSAIEHHAVLNSCAFLESLGFEVTYLPVNSEGMVSAKEFEGALRADTILASIMLANNEIGIIESIRELSAIAHERNILFHTDAVQAVGHIPVDVKELGVDLLSASAHKFNGPKGIGFLFIADNAAISPLLSGGSQEYGKRAGTENVAAIVGMETALQNNIDSMVENIEHIGNVSKVFVDHLSSSGLDYLINGAGHRLPGFFSISFRDIEGEVLLHRLDLAGISVSTGAACNSHDTVLSHVISAIGIDPQYAYGTIRISIGKYNTVDEVVKVANVLSELILSLRSK